MTSCHRRRNEHQARRADVDILITAEFTDDARRQLEAAGHTTTHIDWSATGKPLGTTQLTGALQNVQALISEHETVDESVFAACPDLRYLIVCRGTPSSIDLEAAARHGVAVATTPARNLDAVADFTIGCMIDLVRHVSASDKHLRTTGWMADGRLPYFGFRGRELASLTLGIVGLGATGTGVAQRAVNGFGMTVLGHSRSPKNIAGVADVPLGELLTRSDVVSLHCPLTPDTRGLIGRDEFQAMKRSAYLINMARGPVINRDALVAALHAGEIAGAALDVHDPEPLPAGDELFGFPNVLLTPHTAGATAEVVTRHSQMAVDTLHRLLSPDS